MQQGSSTTATLTDEQIVGLDPVSAANDSAASLAQRVDAGASVAQGADALIASDPESFFLDGDGAVAPVARQTIQNDMEADPARDPRLFAGADTETTSGLPRENRDERRASDGRQPELQTAASASDPVWLRTLEAQPQGGREAAAEARAWRAAAGDVAALDASYFSAEPSARAGLAARLYDSDPAAFRAMLAESARVIAQRDPQALTELARQLGAPAPAAAQSPRTAATPSLRAASREANSSVAQVADAALASDPEAFSGRFASRQAAAQNPQGPRQNQSGHPELQSPAPANAAAAFPAEAYRAFEAATNEDVAGRVRQAIDHTLSQTLPEGTAEGARRRIAADIFQEVQTSLSADRDLSRRVGETLRDWRFDAAARQQVASLLSGRARAVLPEVARRVVTEWTSSVLASDRAKMARIDAATARREVSGGRVPEPVPPSALRPRVDYRRMSDAQILDL